MTPEQWERVKELVQGAMAVPPPDRAIWLRQACAGEPDLLREAASLLEADAAAGTFLETPALARPDMADAFDTLEGYSTWAGRRVGPYSLVREIGHGGMGAVYLAVRSDDEYRQQVAIKVIQSSFAPEFVARRFRHERQILAELDHPNIARLLDGGSTKEGAPYFVMEYVDGVPIDQYCVDGDLSIDARLDLFREVCDAVQYAHQHLVVHRDLKPSNILVTHTGTPKLLDFGIAKLIDADRAEESPLTTMPVMTLDSASPEQIRGETVTTATDIYSLGVLLHRLLTGRRPYEASTTATHELAREICEKEVRRPSESGVDLHTARRLRGDLDTIVLKAMQKDPARRYPSAEQFAQDVGAHLSGRPVRARPDTIRYRTTKFVSRHKAGLAAAVLAIASLVGGMVATAWEAHIARIERARAERRFNDVRRLANSFLFEFHDAIEDLPGATKARELVVRRALEYLDSLARESATDASLQRELSAAYEKVGDVQGLPDFANLGDLAGGLKSHNAAMALRETLAASQPRDPALQRELAATYSHTSSILKHMGNFSLALERAQKAQAIRRQLLALNPSGTAERTSIAIGYHDIGGILSAQGNYRDAIQNIRLEAQTFEAVLQGDPSSSRAQRNAAIAYKGLGAQLERGGDRAGALVNYRKAVVLDEARARADPRDPQTRLDLSYSYASIGYATSWLGDTDGALENYRKALALREEVAAADPNDVHAAEAVERAHVSIGQVFRKAARWADATAEFQKVDELASKRYAAAHHTGSAGNNLADAYAALAGMNAERAVAATNGGNAGTYWQYTRTWAQKALAVRSEQAARGSLSASAKADRDTLVALIARSQAASVASGPK